MAKDTSKPTKGQEKLPDGTVRVWSEVGATLPIGETYANIRFSFGHERIAKSSTQAEIRKTAELVDEFNEAELERRLDKYRRIIGRIMTGDDDEQPTARDRARKKMKSKK